MKRINTLGLLISCFILGGCMSIGLNFKYKTPKNASKYPKFQLKDSLLGYNNEYRNCYDVKHYDINLKINIDEKCIAGSVKTNFSLLKKTSIIQIDLDPQFKIDSIVQNHTALKFTRKLSALFVNLISNDSLQSITVFYNGKPKIAKKAPWQGGFVWKKDKNKNPFVSLACEGDGAQVWLPIKSYLGDEPDSVTTHYTVPNNLVAVSNGKLTSVIDNGNFKTFTWQTSYAINPYNISMYIGKYKSIQADYTCIDGEHMILNHYVLDYNYSKALDHFKQVEGILKTFEELFGKYPWPKDGYKLVESPFAGMEHQTAIAYGNGYKNEKNETYDYIILHETAHEWWGNAVSVSDFSDLWIHEGIATYAEALFVEKTKGYKAYIDYTYWNSILVKNKKPIIGPKDVYYSDYKDGDVYMKGAVMLHTLRNHINNDTLFFSILKTFFKENCYKIVTTSDFIKIVNKLTGKDYNYFFNQYLYKRESPLLKWNFDHNENTGLDVLIFQFERVNPDFTLLIPVEQGKSRFYIIPSSKPQYITLPSPASEPVSVNYKNSYIQDGFKKMKRIKSK